MRANIISKVSVKLAVTALFAVTCANFASADDKMENKNTSAHKAMAPEMKKDMAEMYMKMGECLKTDKSMEECQKMIMKDCPVAKSMGYCPIMDGMKSSMMKNGKMKSMSMDHEQK